MDSTAVSEEPTATSVVCEDGNLGRTVSSVAHSVPPGPDHGPAVASAAQSDCGKTDEGVDSPTDTDPTFPVTDTTEVADTTPSHDNDSGHANAKANANASDGAANAGDGAANASDGAANVVSAANAGDGAANAGAGAANAGDSARADGNAKRQRRRQRACERALHRARQRRGGRRLNTFYLRDAPVDKRAGRTPSSGHSRQKRGLDESEHTQTARRCCLRRRVHRRPGGTRVGEGDTPPEPAKCNSGRGNDSETTPDDDCDPGNSGGHNNGGD